MKHTIIATALSALSLPAAAQNIEAATDVVDIGQVMFRRPVTAEFSISNKGTRTATVSAVETSCGCTTAGMEARELPPGAAGIVSVTYDAKQLGHFEKQVTVYEAGSEEPLLLTLRGVVVSEVVDFSGEYPYKLGELLADKDAVEFDDVNRGDRPYVKIHVMNPTSSTVQPVVMHLPDYLKAEVSPSSIAPNHGGVVTIMLNSGKLRDLGLTQTAVYMGKAPGEKVSADKELSVSAVLLPGFGELTERQMAAAPRISLSGTDIHLGSLAGKSKGKGEIEITNTGKSALEIRNLQLFTTGLQVSLKKAKLKPGEKTTLKVSAAAKALRSARKKPRVLMITNDPAMPKVVITVSWE